MQPIDTAGKGIEAILELKAENRQLRNDLEKMTIARGATEKILDFYTSESRKLQQQSQDYKMLAGLILWVWAGFMGIVVYG